MNNEALKKVWLVSAGHIAESSKHSCWKQLSAADSREPMAGLLAFKSLRYPIGAVVAIDADCDESGCAKVMHGKPEYIGRFADKGKITEWEVRSRANLLNRKVEAKAHKRETFSALEPVRRIYRYASERDRSVILAEIIRYIQS